MIQEPIVLALETALQNGSLSLLKGEREISSIKGEDKVEGKVSRAEDFLQLVSKLLKSSDLSIKEVDLIAVSEGPGSYTGIRVGLATVQGLAMGCQCPVIGVSMLEALAFSAQARQVVSIIRMGRDQFVWQEFSNLKSAEAEKKEPLLGTLADFGEFIEKIEKKEVGVRIASKASLQHEIQMLCEEKEAKLTFASDNTSKTIGLYAYFLHKNLKVKLRISPQYILETKIARKQF